MDFTEDGGLVVLLVEQVVVEADAPLDDDEGENEQADDLMARGDVS